MKLIIYSIGLFLIFGLFQVFAASFEDEDDLRTQSSSLEAQLLSLYLEDSDMDSVNKYLLKIVKAIENKNSSASSTTIGELKETVDKYSRKLLKLVGNCDYLAPENQIQAYELVKSFLNQLDEHSPLDENVSTADDHFIEGLRVLPFGGVASGYVKLWNSLNVLEAQNLSHEELIPLLDSAVVDFTREFTAAVCSDIEEVISDPIANTCLFIPSSDTYNKALAKITELLPEDNILKEGN